jgi:hypothetical protein
MQAWVPRQQLESAVDDTAKMTLSHDLVRKVPNPDFLVLLILKRGKVSSRLQ